MSDWYLVAFVSTLWVQLISKLSPQWWVWVWQIRVWVRSWEQILISISISGVPISIYPPGIPIPMTNTKYFYLLILCLTYIQLPPMICLIYLGMCWIFLLYLNAYICYICFIFFNSVISSNKLGSSKLPPSWNVRGVYIKVRNSSGQCKILTCLLNSPCPS